VTDVVRAAGGVPVRAGSVGPEVLLIHRPRYDDWTLPKGKCHRGESDEDCALREVEEETGLACTLGIELPSTEYVDPKGRPKRVRYWSMRVVDGDTRPAPPEVDEVRWVPAAVARDLLSYLHDVAVVEAAEGAHRPPD
jgi:8-oxo-dGTP pyrophosphatase MutT (NUDIX family)